MCELITDQRKLLKLAFSLSVDVDFLIERIKADPATLDKTARAQLLEGVFNFLGEAIGFKEVQEYLSSKVLEQAKPTNAASVCPVPPSRKNRVGLQQTKIAAPAVDTTPTGLAITNLLAAVKAVSSTSIHQGVPALGTESHAIGSEYQLRKSLASPLSSTPNRNSAAGGHCLIISNAPNTIPGKVRGGPLERLIRNPPDKNGKYSFLINFINRKAATSFLDYSKTPVGQHNLSGPHGSFVVEWYGRGNFQNPKVLSAARRQVDPARRTLVFCKNGAFPEPKLRNKLATRMRVLDPRFTAEFGVEACWTTPDKKEVHFLFTCIEAAMKAMECHEHRLLGPDFEGSKVVFGKDPCDRPLPKTENTDTEPPHSTPGLDRKANIAAGSQVANPRGPEDPTENVLAFHNYPWNFITKGEMKHRLQTLDKRFFSEYSLDEYKVDPQKALAIFVFNKIEAAIKVVECHKLGLFGAEFENAQVFFGSGSGHRPIPVVAIPATEDITLGSTSARSEPADTTPAAPVSNASGIALARLPAVHVPSPTPPEHSAFDTDTPIAFTLFPGAKWAAPAHPPVTTASSVVYDDGYDIF